MIWTGLMTWCAAPVMSRTSAEIRHEQKATIAVAFFVPGANLGWPVRVAVQASLSQRPLVGVVGLLAISSLLASLASA